MTSLVISYIVIILMCLFYFSKKKKSNKNFVQYCILTHFFFNLVIFFSNLVIFLRILVIFEEKPVAAVSIPHFWANTCQ